MFHFSYFNKHVMNPIQRYGYVGEGRKAMLTLKNDVMDRIMLRRTKKERAADLRLPDLEVGCLGSPRHVDLGLLASCSFGGSEAAA